MKYTQHQIDEAYSQKEGLQDMIRHLEALSDLASENDMPDLGMMVQDLQSDVETRLDEVNEIIRADYRQQVEDELRSYFAAVM